MFQSFYDDGISSPTRWRCLSGISAHQRERGFAEAFDQARRFHDRGVIAPTENPAFNLFKASEIDRELEFTVRERLQFLTGMPFALRDEAGGERIEVNADAATACGDDLGLDQGIFRLPRRCVAAELAVEDRPGACS